MKLLILIIPLLLQEPSPQEKVHRIEQAIDWLIESDPELRQAGRKILLEAGPEAIFRLERRMSDRGLDRVYEVLRILHAKSGPEATGWVGQKDLPDEEELKKELPRVPKKRVDQYVFSKYYEAWRYAKSGNFQKAMGIAEALLLLEPKSRYRQKLGELRRFCDHRLTQETLCEASVVSSKSVAIRGEKLECSLRIRNRRDQEIRFQFSQEGRGFALVNQVVRVPALRGDEHEYNRSRQVRFENDIPIAADAQWEHSFLLDTGAELDLSQDLQIVTVHAWMLPRRIGLGDAGMTRRIIFEPAVIRVVAKKYEPDLADPLSGLRRAIESGTVNDVFVLSHLLEGGQKETGIGLLVAQLSSTKTEAGSVFLTRLLAFLTGEKIGPRGDKWVEWWKSRKESRNP